VIGLSKTTDPSTATVIKETPNVTSLRRLAVCFAAAMALVLAAILPAAASAADSPAWEVTVMSTPTNVLSGQPHVGNFPAYYIVLTNVGGAPTSGPVTIEDTLPAGLNPAGFLSPNCDVTGQTFSCEDGGVNPGESRYRNFGFSVDGSLPEPSTLTNTVTVTGGGAPTATASTTTTISSAIPSFGFVGGEAGLSASLTGTDGQPATQAGSHPNQLTVDLGFNTRILFRDEGEQHITGTGGGLHDTVTTLPAGLIVNPLSIPIRCTEAQLESDHCPDEAAVGVITASVPSIASAEPGPSPLYSMVPVGGQAATLGTNIGGIGVFAHLAGSVGPPKYAITSTTNDILARAPNPVVGIRVQLWGDASSPIHDHVRSICVYNEGHECPVTPRTTPGLSMPTSCTESMTISDRANGWAEQGNFAERSAPLTDSNDTPTGVDGCGALQFNASLEARPTTTVADAPSGLSADLEIPQTNDLNTPATAHLRTADVLLPEGLVINPASGNGLAGCSSAQIGVDPSSGLPNGNQPTCPDASRVGTVEVDSPLVDHTLPGSIYIASPHDNPFDSLLAIYVVVNDPASGVLIKLPGHVIADPQTGRLRTIFDENPQLPFSKFKLDFFGGATAPLRTPSTCGEYTTTSEMTPWSAPDSGPPATTTDTYAIDKGPGRACATSANALPSEPFFDAGTVSPIAGKYSPFVLNLRRDDGTQTFSAIDLTPPPGLLGKLAGTPYCPEAALAAAASKSGNAEKASPSCPSASKVGTVTVGAGAGPAPYYAQGNVYLAPPYKGAPLSMAIITPAAAGPYDLGTVVVRTAVHVDPATARISATSDPIPQILQGIPLDVRSVQLALDKPNFTLNPTSCDPFSVDGQLTSALGQLTSLQSRFQVAECGRLAFKPKLSIKLKGATKRGGHPALTAVLRMPEGGANIGKASVALPHSEFLDQAHIATVCTRVQYAAHQCPAGSIYGHASAISPLLDQPLTGPVYLRSSNNKLPDLVLSLDGQIQVDVTGRIDSVKGGIRTSFESVPDAPVSKFVLRMAGAKKGLLVNSTDICKSTNKAKAFFDGQNSKAADSQPPLVPSCKGKGRKGHRRHHR
jgi:uncharacterized repeat protein (TIGR01451 family)